MNKVIDQKGFTLIELMIVVAIIGILVSIALPAYQDFTVRTKITEGLSLAQSAKTEVAQSAEEGGPPVIASSGNEWNASFTPTKYVSNIEINVDVASPQIGQITISMNTNSNALPILAGQNQIIITPGYRVSSSSVTSLNIFTNGFVTGPIDWACTGATTQTASNTGFGGIVSASGSGVPARYMPGTCK